MLTTRRDGVHGVALYHRSPLTSGVGSASPRSLQWMKVRQTACSRADPAPTGRPEFYTREAGRTTLGVGKTTVSELTTRGVIGVAYIAPEANDPGGRTGPVH